MKLPLVLLAITLGLTASLSAQTANDSPRLVTPLTRSAKAAQDAAVARAVRNHRCIYYITNYTATGSHIPQVVTIYEGYRTVNGSFTTASRSAGSVYNAGDISLTGSLSVGGALREIDPAISSVR